MLFNKDLGISAQFFGDMKIIDSSLIDRKKIKKNIKDIPELKNKKIFAYLETTAEPNYETILFFDKIRTSKDTITRTELFLNDTKNNQIVYKKSKSNKIVYLFLKPQKVDKHDYLADSKELIKKVTFDNEKLNKTSYSEVFFGIMDNPNYLETRKILKSNILTQTNEQKWNQYQFLTTINSFISNNSQYDSLISKKTSRYQVALDSLEQINTFETKEVIFNKFKSLTKDKRIVMLNEKHWNPNHRLLAFQFLEILKQNGFKYLAVEAVNNRQDSVINVNQFPSKISGYYIREPYFGHLIRKAKSLGFTIVSYDDMESKNRELSQALNIKKILDTDPEAKVFVYAGVDHILESNPNRKWMAEYLKDLTQINPLTFNQEKIVGQTKQELVLIPSNALKNVKSLNTSVDYFIVNNLKPNLEAISSNQISCEKIISSKKLINKNVLIRIYYKNEYDKIGKNAIPMFITSVESQTSEIKLNLPAGSYFVSLLSDKNEKLVDDFIIVK